MFMISSGKLTQPVYFNVVLGKLPRFTQKPALCGITHLLQTLFLTVVVVACISVIGMSESQILFQKSFEFASFQWLTPSSMPKKQLTPPQES